MASVIQSVGTSRPVTREEVDAEYQALLAAIPAADGSADAWEALFWKWNDLMARVESEASRRRFRESQNTRDEAAEAASKFMREQIAPVVQKGDAALREAFLASPVRAELETRLAKQLFVRMELEQAGFAQANIELQVQEGEIVNQYQRLIATAVIETPQGPLTMTKAIAALNDPDAATRRGAWEGLKQWTDQTGAEIHRLYDALIGIRHQKGLNVGERNFVPLAYRLMGRSDYGAKNVAVFRDSIHKYVVPVLNKLRARQAEWLGTDRVVGPDSYYFPGLSLGANVVPVDKQLDQTQALFDQLHPTLAGHFRRMVEEGLIDLENRPGKRAGAFATSFDDENKVAIFCNSTGAEGDISTLIHEMGHAFQGWESLWIKPVAIRWPTYDACEIHSMGMEFLALPYITAFFTPEQARQFKSLKLIDTLVLLSYIAMIDEFQHWVYEHPGHTHAEREAQWEAIWDKYEPMVDYDGEYLAKQFRWMYKQHLFTSPFYYIDYGLAEVGALQLWRLDMADHQRAMDAYLELCRIGGTRSLLEIFSAAGLENPFNPEVMAPLMATIEKELAL